MKNNLVADLSVGFIAGTCGFGMVVAVPILLDILHTLQEIRELLMVLTRMGG